MTPFETAIIAIVSSLTAPLVTLLGLYIKDVMDKQRLANVEKRRAMREAAAEEARAARAQALADELTRNTILTQQAVQAADRAYTEANNFNGKLAETRQAIAESISSKDGC